MTAVCSANDQQTFEHLAELPGASGTVARDVLPGRLADDELIALAAMLATATTVLAIRLRAGSYSESRMSVLRLSKSSWFSRVLYFEKQRVPRETR